MSDKQKRRVLVMLCTGARGGMRSVVENYRRDGLFEKYHVMLLETHREGSLSSRLGVAAASLWKLLQLLVSGEVAGVHAHLAMKGSFWRKSLFCTVARLFGVPVISHLHGSELKVFHASLGQFGKRLFRYQLESSAAVIVLSDSWARFVLECAPRADVVVIPNYVKIPQVSGAHEESPVFTVLFLGLVGERKGVFDLLPAFRDASREARQQGVRMRLLIGGNGAVEQAQRKSEELGVAEDVEFLGWVDANRRSELLNGADVFVLPSHNEGLPMAILEAMAASLPIISTRVGGIPELVRNDVDGFLIEPKDTVALSHALLSAALRRPEAKGMGASGRERVAAEFSDIVVLPVIDKLYRRCFGQ
jgi:glycosyltransferase involved in cell wall biosynthesis